jgi:MtN3 and saliva related transmembrane protein
VIRTWRTRSTGDISLGMFVTYVTGILLWLVYGPMLGDIPLIASNAVTFVLCTVAGNSLIETAARVRGARAAAG